MPEIADIEISSGKCHNNCPFCYKSNRADGKLHNMTFEEFKDIFHKLTLTSVAVEYKNGDVKVGQYNSSFDCYPKAFNKNLITDYIKERLTSWGQEVKNVKIYNKGLLNQIAFGITSPTDNQDFFKMMEYARNFDVIPNYTIKATDMTDEVADLTVNLCGACAVSFTDNLEVTYKAVNKLLSRGMSQVNIHAVAMTDTFDTIKQIIQDVHDKNGINGLNALVLLKYKPKGTNAGKFKALNKEQYKEIFDLATKLKVGLGFDSCSAPVYLDTVKDLENYKALSEVAEPCESTLFSVYINSYGEMSPCSFAENENRNGQDWTSGINVLNVTDFYQEVWNNERVKSFREQLLNNGRNCPLYNLKG